jgi:DNA modification methylase
MGSDARRGLKEHPTVKPTAMLEDALLDLTNRDDVVLDPFLGSGSTLIAAEKTGRRCRGVEIDPRYVDLTIRRWQHLTGRDAILQSTEQTFSEILSRQAAIEALPSSRPSTHLNGSNNA